MATLESLFPFTGRIGDLSAYRRKGTGKIVIRRAGGPSKRQIQTEPSFDRTRRNIAEFAGAVRMTKLFRQAFHQLLPVADADFTGRLNAFFRSLLVFDTASEFGKRSVLLSENPKLLEGLPFNKWLLFESVFQSMLLVQFVNEQNKVRITFPTAISGVNLTTDHDLPFYRFEAAATILPNVGVTQSGYRALMEGREAITGNWKCSQWFSTTAGSEETSIGLSLSELTKVVGTLVVCVGIRFGGVNKLGAVGTEKVGSAKVVLAIRSGHGEMSTFLPTNTDS